MEGGTTGVVAHGFKEDGNSSPPVVVGGSVVVGLGIEERTPQILERRMGWELAQCLEAIFNVNVTITQLTGLLHLKVHNFGSSGRITVIVIRIGGARSVKLRLSVCGIELRRGY